MQPLFTPPMIATNHTLDLLVDALANPGRVVAMDGLLNPPRPLHFSSAAVCHSCLNDHTRLWTDLDPDGITGRWLSIVCGGRHLSRPNRAEVVVITQPLKMPSLDSFTRISRSLPYHSPLLVIQTRGFVMGSGQTLDGKTDTAVEQLTVKGLKSDFWDMRKACLQSYNTAPDLVFTYKNLLVAVPGQDS